MKKVHIIKFHCFEFAVESITVATKTMELLAKLQPVKMHHSDDYRTKWYEPEESPDRLGLEMNQEFRGKPKHLALPKPKRGTVRCPSCAAADVRPYTDCPRCGVVCA